METLLSERVRDPINWFTPPPTHNTIMCLWMSKIQNSRFFILNAICSGLFQFSGLRREWAVLLILVELLTIAVNTFFSS